MLILFTERVDGWRQPIISRLASRLDTTSSVGMGKIV